MSVRPQAIAGVSAGSEQLLRVVYPSISAAGLGRLIGRGMNAVPSGVGVFRLSYLLAPFWALLALPGYFIEKIFGERYILTTHNIARWTAMGHRMLQQVPLADVGDIVLDTLPGQEFYKASDLVILGKDGNPRMRLPAVPHADIFRETILKAARARVQVEESLTRIRARAGAK